MGNIFSDPGGPPPCFNPYACASADAEWEKEQDSGNQDDGKPAIPNQMRVGQTTTDVFDTALGSGNRYLSAIHY